MMMPNAPTGHSYNDKDVCSRCGRSREAVVAFDIECAPLALEPPPLPRAVAEPSRRLARPLEIVSRQNPRTGVLEALLVSDDDHDAVAASVRGSAVDFDPDAAFRELDDLRTRAEDAYQWVADGIAEVDDPPTTVEPPRKRGERGAKPVSWGEWWASNGRVVLASIPCLAVLAFAVSVPGNTVFEIAYWTFVILGGLLVIGGLTSGCLPGIAAFVALVVVAAIVEATGMRVGLSRAFLPLLAFLLTTAFLSGSDDKPKDGAAPAPTGGESPDAAKEDAPLSTDPVEHVIRKGEAASYVPGLYLAGERRVLAVAIECKDDGGNLLRRVILPVAGVTRESAAEAVRMAKAPDQQYAEQRLRDAAEAEVAAAALERIQELERGRRSLPE
ncbi:MAG TPA: hypothetical protein VF625_10375 [Longimicrobium sp.]